ncbi:hypothetical protein MNEG_6027 [Monoraphidium neglectum]|uniref:Uncharacterized protein n=1 Tax=Monoraphidium neglectum TaxID=145388 RepID=A0A0D2MMZ3_9CHLO|nr:hypothetical protein MNEG_6027 [Monoraphidium neglectum]KIZ01932.1 hypothetical protein MNEG_6027 [Monoraphidium neglectum]|eukprot:XP_013900951.1 hypothetical protein MNEG_6027 [Monoraphidium neglectum]
MRRLPIVLLLAAAVVMCAAAADADTAAEAAPAWAVEHRWLALGPALGQDADCERHQEREEQEHQQRQQQQQQQQLLSFQNQGIAGNRVVVPFLTHFGDLTSWEFAQKLQKKALGPLQEAGVKVISVGLGSPESARTFAAALDYPLEGLYADPTGACCKALGFSPGFADSVEGVDPYLKLLPMLMGIGSPGTVQEVLRGYVGDREAPPVFDGTLGRAFDILGKGYQRPLELATLRLQNMVGVLSKWGDLAPSEKRLLTQQGGCIVFDGCDVVYRHADPGILKYADVDAVVQAATQAPRKLIAKQRE